MKGKGNIYKNWKEGEISIHRDTKNNGRIGFGLVNVDIAKEMMIKNHYSQKWNTQFGIINIGVYKDRMLKGVASFGRLMNPRSFKSIIESDDMNSILELNRLWVSDELSKNIETLLISVSFKYIKNNRPEIKAIQSFADGRLGCGTIYKASNFKYYGYSESVFFEDVETGVTYHKVPLENTKRPTGFKKLNLLYINGKLKPFKVKTYRYIYLLDNQCEIKLKEKPYPEYDIGYEYISYKPTCNQLYKLYYILDLQKDYENKEIVKQYIINNYKQTEIDTSRLNTEKYFNLNIEVVEKILKQTA